MFLLLPILLNNAMVKELRTSCFYYCILLNNAMVKCTEKEGSGLLGGGMPSALTTGKRTFALKPLPNKDITA